MNEATWTVQYIPRGKTEILTARVRMDLYDGKFTATCLDVWGCGKSSFTPRGAINALVQDMAHIVSAIPNS